MKAGKDQQRGRVPGAESVVRGRVQGAVEASFREKPGWALRGTGGRQSASVLDDGLVAPCPGQTPHASSFFSVK